MAEETEDKLETYKDTSVVESEVKTDGKKEEPETNTEKEKEELETKTEKEKGEPKANTEKEKEELETKTDKEKEESETLTKSKEPETNTENEEPNINPENEELGTNTENEEPNINPENEEPGTNTENDEPETLTENEEPGTDSENEEPGTDSENEEPDTDTDNEEPEQEHGEFTVFVGKLITKVTAERLREHFKAAGEIVAVSQPLKVLMKTKRRGFAFINFADKEAYEAALKMDQSELDGKAILVLPASKTHIGFLAMDAEEEEKPDEKKQEKLEEKKFKEAIPFAPLYKQSKLIAHIKNLPHGTSEDDILKFFGVTRENIVAITIAYPSKMKQKVKKPMCAIIEFKTTEDLEKALGMTNKQLNGQEVVVERHMTVVRPEKRSAEEGQDGDVTASKRQMTVVQPEKRSGEEGQDGDVTPNKQAKTAEGSKNNSGTDGMELDLFVKFLPKEATHKQIRDFFGCAGANIRRIGLFLDPSGTSKGMGFLTMANRESVEKGLLMDNKWFFDKKVRVWIRQDREYINKAELVRIAENCFTTFICELPRGKRFETVRTALLEFLEKNGVKVKSVHVPAYPNRPGNKGFAFVVLEDAASLKKTHNLTNSEVFIYDKIYTIRVSDSWPGNPPERASRSSRAAAGGNDDSWFPEYQGARGAEELPPVRESDPHFHRDDFPADMQSRRERDEYLEYLEYREYMMMRSALAKKEELIRRMREREALHQLAVVPSSLDAIGELLLARSALLKKEEPLRGIIPSSGRGEPAGTAASLRTRLDFTDLRELLTSRSKEAVREGIPASGLGSLGGSSSGDRDTSALLQRHSDVMGRGGSGLDRDLLAASESRSIDKHRAAELEAKYGSTADKYGPIKDKYGSDRDKYGSDRDKYGSDRDKYGSDRDKYGSVRDKYGSVRDKYESIRDKYDSVRDKYESNRDKYGSIRDKYGSVEDRYRSARSSSASRRYRDSPSPDYDRRGGGSSSGQGDRRSGSSSLDKPNLVNTLTSPAGLGVLQNVENIIWMGNLNKSM